MFQPLPARHRAGFGGERHLLTPKIYRMNKNKSIAQTLPEDLKTWLIEECDQLGFDHFSSCIAAILQHSDFASRWDFEFPGVDLEKLDRLIRWRDEAVTLYEVKTVC